MDALFMQELTDIKSELTMMREALVTLARVEERSAGLLAAHTRFEAALTAQQTRHDSQLEGVYSRLNKAEAAAAGSAKSMSWVERGVWAVVSAALAALGIHFGGKP